MPRPRNKYAWLVGIVLFMGLGVLLFAQTLPNAGEAVQGPNPGQRLPAFAAPPPTATSRATPTSARGGPARRAPAGPRPASSSARTW